MYKLLGRQTSGNVQKVLFMLEELGASYKREDYGRQFENTQTAEYKALNPTSKVPTLVDGDTVIWESNTILRYLAAFGGEQLNGATPAEKTEVERWMDFLLAAVNPGYLAAFKGAKLTPEEQTAEYKEQVKDLVAQLKIVDGHLAGKDFLALGKLTLADIACAPILKRCVDFKIDRPSMPNLERWVAAIAARPAFKAATTAAPAKAA
ncbi:glutathione S-transferase family protein [Mesorhizobium sp. M7A.F.Ca.CA.001.09.2.1]|jgi:glutathione S-transferase|uniref:Glutathione S-transferase domain n=3 Tax=Mesorhizobium TaxID=68287 RepID=E8TGX4_MESCW|nr:MULTISPECIES: glutathione S-transferase family protein [Mesorhizobium]RUU13524.1 glutathione S-transferase family protein [Mesorhizobium sp. M7A.T.Ca.TU.009.01.3.2]RUU66245.1 glutathione S-transferase family protein [Mesorhizobium sp. M7A.T.Ca.TU.009.01.1.1]RUU81315.1 glutathione S-transferase family protein [Mesorhizobium sp. M7A.T.Ca.TU.009.01.1.2]RUU89953.1 glutathione S-transferase family protein [Mesorhizobium sp. M7A.T.Ca.TU.009.01.3.1]RUY53194.1 glutathione S-transferase family prote